MAEETTNTDTAGQVNTEESRTAEAATETKETDLMGSEKATETDDTLIGGESGEESKEAETEESKAEVPEKYEPFDLKEGEAIGYKMTPEQHEEFSELCKTLGLPQPLAQELLNSDMKRAAESVKAQQEAHVALTKEWQTEIKKEYGDKYPEARGRVNKAYDTFFSSKLQDTFEKAGFNNNPELFRALDKIGGAFSEDTFVKGDNKTGSDISKRTLAQAMGSKT